MTKFEHVTTDAAVDTYKAATGVFAALLNEVRELSKKKPDATLSASKVKLVNNVLGDLLAILKAEPQGKYLESLQDDDLPQVSDALMMMVQFDAALDAFRTRYFQSVRTIYGTRDHYWVTQEQIAAWEAEELELEADDDEHDD